MWNKNDQSRIPELETIVDYINNPLWDKFYSYMVNKYGCSPKIEFSSCSMLSGWNMKFRKSSKSLCTVYPMEGGFITMVVIGDKEANEVQFAFPSFTDYVKKLYNETNPSKNSKWLMIEIQNENVLEDAFKLIQIRRS